MNKLIKCLIIIFVLFLAFVFLTNIAVAPITIKEAEAHEVEEERDDIDRLIDQLAYCESRNNEKAINPHDPDTPSYGLLQFKADTFYRYNAVYKVLPDLERGEVHNVIFDGSTQKTLAKEILKDGGWKNWYNCLKPYFN